jgi:hypothetical protein
VGLGGHRGQGELGERLGDSHNGLELTHGDGDGRARVGLNLRGMYLSANGDEVRGELLGGCFAETWGTPAE